MSARPLQGKGQERADEVNENIDEDSVEINRNLKGT